MYAIIIQNIDKFTIQNKAINIHQCISINNPMQRGT